LIAWFAIPAALAGLKQGLGDQAAAIVRDESFEFSDPTIDPQIVALKSAGADVVFYATGNLKFAAQAIRKVGTEARANPDESGLLHRRYAAARGLGEICRSDYGGIRQAARRSELGERSGDA
jgi:hypothetical protein